MESKIVNETFIIPIYFYIEDDKNIIDEEGMRREFDELMEELKMNSNKYIK